MAALAYIGGPSTEDWPLTLDAFCFSSLFLGAILMDTALYIHGRGLARVPKYFSLEKHRVISFA